jgi:hypothetical protein
MSGYGMTACGGAKRTFNKNRWPVSRHVSFVRIWTLEVAPDYQSCKGRGYAPPWAFQLLRGCWLEFNSRLSADGGPWACRTSPCTGYRQRPNWLVRPLYNHPMMFAR